MPNYNIFKVDSDKKEIMLEKFTAVGLRLKKTTTIKRHKFSFYYSEEPHLTEIEWAKTYADFLDGTKLPKVKNYFAVLLIEFSRSANYAISIGKTHFYLKDFCQYDFGLDLAERILDKHEFRLKAAKHYSSRKNKTITTTTGKDLFYESGESIGLIKGKTVDKDKWGKVATFGQSVKLSIEKSPDELGPIISNIENALAENSNFKLPRAYIIRDVAQIKKLDEILYQKIKTGGVAVDIDEFTTNSVFFNFVDEYDAFALKVKVKGRPQHKTVELDAITIGSLSDFFSDLENNGIDVLEHLDDIKMILYKDGESKLSRPIKELLDFTTDEWCCLRDGKWMKFSQDYISNLKAQIEDIVPRIEPIKLKKYSLSDREKYGLTNEDEESLIKHLATMGYTELHKSLQTIDGYKYEVADMRKDNCLYYVKIGNPQKLAYVINQSLTTVSLMRHQKVKTDKQTKGVTTVCLWLVFDGRSKDVSKLVDVKSVIFLIALNDWIQSVRDAGLIPAITISHRREVSYKKGKPA